MNRTNFDLSWTAATFLPVFWSVGSHSHPDACSGNQSAAADVLEEPRYIRQRTHLRNWPFFIREYTRHNR